MWKLTQCTVASIFLAAACSPNTTGTPSGNPPGGDTDMMVGGGGGFDVRIVQPNGQVSLRSGQNIALVADFTSGGAIVTPTTATWTSDLDGALGTGRRITGVVLSDGTHVVTVTGTHRGDTASDSVTVVVSDIAVEIINPDDGDAEDVGTPVNFEGQASAGTPPVQLVSNAPANMMERTASYSWSSSIDGVIGTAQLFTHNSLTAGTHTVTLTVSDDLAGGTLASGSAAVVIRVRPPNTAPNLNLSSPASCPVDVEQGTTLDFMGSATDAEDGPLTGRWLDSITGTGSVGDTYTLAATAAVGKHEVVFSATDSAGETSTTTCAVFVYPAGGTAADLFPDSSTINDNLAGGSSNLNWIGKDASGNTIIGSADGLTIADDADTVIGTYDAADLDLGAGDIDTNGVAWTSDTMFVATDNGLTVCDYAMAVVSNCDSSPFPTAQYNAVDVNSTAMMVAAVSEDGLLLSDASGGMFSSFLFTDNNSNLPDQDPNDVAFVGNTVFVATDDGLCIIDDPAADLAATTMATLCDTIVDNQSSVLQSDRIASLFEDNGVLWMGTEQGLALYEPATGAMTVWGNNSGIISGRVNDVVVDAAGIVWIGTEQGLSRFDPTTGVFTNFDPGDLGLAPGDDRVEAIHIDGMGTKWLATEGGLVRYIGA